MLKTTLDEKKRKVTWKSELKDIKNDAFNEKYSTKMDKMKKDGWYPEEWFTFLAYGAPAKIPSPSLYIVRIKTEEMPASLVSSSKRKFKDLTIVDALDNLSPAQESDIHIHSKGKKFITNEFVDEDDEDEKDTPSSYALSMHTIRKIKKEDDMKIKPKVDNKLLAKSIKIRAQQESFATLDNQQFIQSRITCDPLVKMKANLLDLQASYKTYKSGEFGELDSPIEVHQALAQVCPQSTRKFHLMVLKSHLKVNMGHYWYPFPTLCR